MINHYTNRTIMKHLLAINHPFTIHSPPGTLEPYGTLASSRGQRGPHPIRSEQVAIAEQVAELLSLQLKPPSLSSRYVGSLLSLPFLDLNLAKEEGS